MKKLIAAIYIVTCLTTLAYGCEDNKPSTTKEIKIAKMLRVKTCKGKRFNMAMVIKGVVCKDNKPSSQGAQDLAKLLRVKTCKGGRFQSMKSLVGGK